MNVTPDQFRILCDIVVKLTELRQKECAHLCIENYAPELLAKLMAATNSGMVFKGNGDPYWPIEH